MGGLRPSIEFTPSSTKRRTLSRSSSSRRRSTLFTTRTIFLPQSRISSRYSRSDSVKGLSEDVTKRTRSERGTKPRLSSSWCRMMALVPGVSTMATSRKKSFGYSLSRTPSRRSRSAGRSPYLRTVILSVVGVTPSRESSSFPSRAFMNADLPELNSPTMTSKNNSSRSTSFWRTSETSSDGEPKSSRKPARRSRRARSRSVIRRQRSSRICI
jgi:hypothetical protein